MWHLTDCKISVSLSFLKWIKNELITLFYRISELMLATLIQRYHIPYINLLNLSWIIKCLFFFGKGAFISE